MNRLWTAERLIMRLAPRRTGRGTNWFGRLGGIAEQPPTWAVMAGALAASGRARRRAAIRGAASSAAAAFVANIVAKPLFHRRRPPGSGKGKPGPLTSSFPSGHAAADVAFVIGVSQEVPALFVPLTLATSAAHWSLVRAKSHYPTDVLAGGTVGLLVALALRLAWPPRPPRLPRPEETPA